MNECMREGGWEGVNELVREGGKKLNTMERKLMMILLCYSQLATTQSMSIGSDHDIGDQALWVGDQAMDQCTIKG
jgi:hypothetical protein